MKSVNVFFVVDDGVTTLTSGVGTVAQHLISGFPDIRRQIARRLHIDLRLHIISFQAPTGSSWARPDLFTRAKKVATATGGSVRVWPYPKALQNNYFNFTTWQEINKQANAYIRRRGRAGQNCIIAFDGIFGCIDTPRNDDVLLWVPHSLGVVHQQAYVEQAARRAWEQRVIALHTRRANHRIGYLNSYARSVLQTSYKVKMSKLHAAPNGFFFPLLYTSLATQSECRQACVEAGIPLNKKLLVAYARADEYKGLDIALAAIGRAVSAETDFHGVVIASTFSAEKHRSDYQRRLAKLARTYPGQITFLSGYEFQLPKKLIQYKKTTAVVQVPRRDFAPLIPAEIALLGHTRLAAIYSNIAPIRKEYPRQSALLVSATVPVVTRAIQAAIRSQPRQLLWKTKFARHRHRSSYNIVANYTEVFASLIGKLQHQEPTHD